MHRFLIVLILVLLLAGCSKEPIKTESSAEAFAKFMEGLGCIVVPIEELTFESTAWPFDPNSIGAKYTVDEIDYWWFDPNTIRGKERPRWLR